MFNESGGGRITHGYTIQRKRELSKRETGSLEQEERKCRLTKSKKGESWTSGEKGMSEVSFPGIVI